MNKLLYPDHRLCLWEIYKDKLQNLANTVEEDLLYEFAPRKQSEADKDTPNVRKLFDLLDGILDFINAHCEELEVEVNEQQAVNANLYRGFDAWCVGLCPKIVGGFYHDYYEDIAKFKKQKSISLHDSEQALQAWQKNFKGIA